ncbi:FYVE, RhoGEF and PH domain-containing protein 5-like, partial [Anneissia japonica]|uniref:FYVE, RhoGEF and PH domain-containing protein 5-like n=1 Tax=Anneissia japonica TaxID=1529436 RepID=UPI001425B03C
MERSASKPHTARKLSRNVFDDDDYVRAFMLRKRMASSKIKNLLSVFEDVESTGDYNESGSTVKKKERIPVDKQCLKKKIDAANMIGTSRPRCEHGSPLSSKSHFSTDEDDDKHDDFDFDMLNVVRRENSATRDDEYFSRRRSRSVPNLAELGSTLPMKNLKGLFLRAQNKDTKPPENTRMQRETPRPDLYTVTVNSNDEGSRNQSKASVTGDTRIHRSSGTMIIRKKEKDHQRFSDSITTTLPPRKFSTLKFKFGKHLTVGPTQTTGTTCKRSKSAEHLPEFFQKSNSLTRDIMTIDNRVHQRSSRRRNLSGPGYLELLNVSTMANDTESTLHDPMEQEKATVDLIALSQEVTNWTEKNLNENSDKLQRIDLEINLPSPTSPTSPKPTRSNSNPKSPTTTKEPDSSPLKGRKEEFRWFSKKRLARVGNILDSAQFSLPQWFPSSPKSKLPPKSPFSNRVFAWNYLQSPTQEEIKNFRNENDSNQDHISDRKVEETNDRKKAPPHCEEALYEAISPTVSPSQIVDEIFIQPPYIPTIKVIPVKSNPSSDSQMQPNMKLFRRDRVIARPKKHPPPSPLKLKPAVPKKPSFLKNLSKHQNGNASPSESGQNVKMLTQNYVGRHASVPVNPKKMSPPNVKNLRSRFETGNFSTNETKGTSPKTSPVPHTKPTSFQKDTRSSGKDTHLPDVKPKPKIQVEPYYDDPTNVQKSGDISATDNSYCVPSHSTAPYDSVPLSETKTENTLGPYAVVNLDPSSETASITVNKRPRKLSQSRRKIYENIAANKNAGEMNGSNTSGDSGYSPRDSKNSESADESKFSDSDIDDGPIGCDSDFSDDVDSLIGDDENTIPTNANEENFDITTFTSDYQKVAYEVLTTERKYIDKLYLLDQVFRLRIGQSFPTEVVHQVFSNISSIYNFHKDFLLPQLEERMQQWDSKPRIGDIMKLLAPFLRMYSDYVGNFDNAMKQLQIWTSKSTKFAAMIQQIQADPMCHQLSLQHHMLEPVQRVPRYQLLLKDYLKKLPEDSEDKTDAEKALDLISAAAQHSNNFMKSMDKFQKLLKINQMLDGEDIIDPTREFLKEGKITKIAARSGDQQDRYLFLFNDVLICAQNRKLIGGAASYKVKARLDIDGMKIFDGENSRYDHTFRLESKQKTLELQGYSDEEKEAWMRAIVGAIQEHLRRKETFKTLSVDKEEPESPLSTGPVDGEVPLGSRAPRWVRDDEATMCMRCALDFGLTRRRH